MSELEIINISCNSINDIDFSVVQAKIDVISALIAKRCRNYIYVPCTESQKLKVCKKIDWSKEGF